MTIIKFTTRKERAFAELVEEASQLERQGYFVVISDDDETAKHSNSLNVADFPVKDHARNYLESEMERENGLKK